ncbi:hypothetical protein ACIPY2_19665 [Paenarthrobacter sp. NPDC089675]|uniref:ParB family protein n=1 Tax=Paenarthrobacter TaxID=1742992 RepID=UPI00382E64F0
MNNNVPWNRAWYLRLSSGVGGMKSSGKKSPYFTDEDLQQIRAAVQAVGELEGYASITDFVEAAARRELRRLQRKYNEGRKWPGVEAGQLRPGRRTRAETAVWGDRAQAHPRRSSAGGASPYSGRRAL